MNYQVAVIFSTHEAQPNAEFFWLDDARQYKDELNRKYKEERSDRVMRAVLTDLRTGKEME